MKFFLILISLMSFTIVASTKSKEFDLEANMKKMGLEFKRAVKASDSMTFSEHLKKLKVLVTLSKTAKFPNDKKQISIEGLNKVLDKIQQAQLLNKNGKLEEAKKNILTIDKLRKEYHKHHKPNFWQLIFG
ncbi:cytochrome b562 [Pseudoalteromonas denitrificans]|uniref:Soluble cytochrome b562 n=1 Tax=Pseudoalteromonas denitrificans DSM 6059 TaxID=1123010 RepID=A0A1I1GXC1_9GAMM|nr:cytochrome b562 [Pseudoalteromonas denitrificans]SFC16324.1 soluble cytochrome b562 [Pseudoalteromonas denitrificans DSM 6059]